jgi:hypothetical protein
MIDEEKVATMKEGARQALEQIKAWVEKRARRQTGKRTHREADWSKGHEAGMKEAFAQVKQQCETSLRGLGPR